jgi:hypothetical protein
MLTKQRFNVQGYTSKVLTLGDKALAAEFVEVPVEVLFADVEKVGSGARRGAAAGRVSRQRVRLACCACSSLRLCGRCGPSSPVCKSAPFLWI